jgi:hypothetical protein
MGEEDNKEKTKMKKGGESSRANGRVRKDSWSLNISPTIFCYFPTLCLV